jgi:hypothetical protein
MQRCDPLDHESPRGHFTVTTRGLSLKSGYELGISHSGSPAVTGVTDLTHTPRGPSAQVAAHLVSSMNSAIDVANPCNAVRPVIGPDLPGGEDAGQRSPAH